MDIWPELYLTQAKFSLVLERADEFARFPEAVLRGALGYFWHDEGERFAPLFDLFFGASEKGVHGGIATPPVGGMLDCMRVDNKVFELDITLFGNHEDKISLLNESLIVLGREGVGAKYVRFYIEGLPHIKTSTLRECLSAELIDGQTLPESYCPSHGVELSITKPMTLKALGGRFLMEWDTVTFFRNLVQRLKLLSQFYGEPLPENWCANLGELTQIRTTSATHQEMRSRRSSRQQANLDYSGFVGQVIIRNISGHLFDLIRMGGIVGVGKNTVMGSGRYTISLL